jgi:protein-tyrosine phosphatase
MRQILFICSGNYYRSRFAEALFNHTAEERGLAWRAFSRGLATHLVDGSGDLSTYTRFALGARNIPLRHTGVRPVQIAAADLERAALIFALKEAEHRPLMRELFPDWENRVEYWHIHDLDGAAPDVSIPAIDAQIARVFARIAEMDASAQAGPRHP